MTRSGLNLFSVVTSEFPKEAAPPPQELLAYHRANALEKLKIQASGFFRQKHIEKCLEDKWGVDLHNRNCFLWLDKVRKGEKDLGKLKIINEKMLLFKRAITSGQEPFRALRLDWRKYNIEDGLSRIMEELNNA